MHNNCIVLLFINKTAKNIIKSLFFRYNYINLQTRTTNKRNIDYEKISKQSMVVA